MKLLKCLELYKYSETCTILFIHYIEQIHRNLKMHLYLAQDK